MNTQAKQYGNSIRFRMLKWIHPVMMTLLMLCFWEFVYVPAYDLHVPLYGHVLLTSTYIVMLYEMDKVYHALTVGFVRVPEMVYSQSLAILICDFLAYFAGCLFCREFLVIIPLLVMILLQFGVCVVWSLTVNRAYYRNYRVPKTAIFYGSEKDLKRIQAIRHFAERFEVTARIGNPGELLAPFVETLDGVQAVFASGIDHALQEQIAVYCMMHAKKAYFMPTLEDVIIAGAEYMPVFAEPVMKIQRAQRNTGYLATKRATDVVVSLLGLIVASPVMLATAIAIKLNDGGPVFYRQNRLTLEGRVFPILKFRSMRTDAEKDGVARLASENDSRITPVGRLIRATRIDELPQLINIFLGDMSLVGPRPERPEIAAQYEKDLPEFALRLQVRAGLTGMAQVYGRYNTDPYNKLKMDLLYINRLSFLTDFRLIFATIKILFLKESTEGVRDGQTTAAEATKPEGEESA